MTRFERDYNDILNGETWILRKRKEELEQIEAKGRASRNGFITQCLAQQYRKLKAEYDELDALI